MDNYTPTKVCSKCGIEKPATTEYFHRKSSNSNGLNPKCKDCVAEYYRVYYQNNREKWLARTHKYRIANRDKFLEYRRRYRFANRDKENERVRKWYRANTLYFYQYAQLNKERVTKYRKQWASKNRDKRRISVRNRRARQRNLPNTLTLTEWTQCLDYFNGCCAVCGRPLQDLFGTHIAAADHYIPLLHPDCPGTTALNIIPLCNGEDGCNQSKGSKHPEQWLVERFGRRKANRILGRIQAYFEWVKQQNT